MFVLVCWCAGCWLQVGLSVQEEEPRSLPLAARFSPAPGTLLQHSLHHVLAQDSPATSTTPDAVSGLAGVSRQHTCCWTDRQPQLPPVLNKAAGHATAAQACTCSR